MARFLSKYFRSDFKKDLCKDDLLRVHRYLRIRPMMMFWVLGLSALLSGMFLVKPLQGAEFKFNLGAEIDTAFTLTLDEKTTPSGKKSPRLGDLSIPVDFLYYMDFKVAFNENHLLMLSWELDFENKLTSRFEHPASWETALTADSWGERELRNKLVLAYIAQPLPLIWLTPYLEYNILATTHDEVFDLTKSLFTYHAYRIGFQLGFHQDNQYFIETRDLHFDGWSSALSLSYGDYYFATNQYATTTLTFPASIVPDDNVTDTSTSFDLRTLKNFLNYKDFTIGLETVLEQKNLQWSIGYASKITFIANELLLNRQYFTAASTGPLLSTTQSTHSTQSVFTRFKTLFAERKESLKGSSGDYWGEFAFAYLFEADFYPDEAVTIAYANAPNLLEFVNPLAHFTSAEHDLALYARNDHEKHIHRLTLEPRLNFLPRYAWTLHYGWTIIDYQNYISADATARSLGTNQQNYRLDQIHSFRMGFAILNANNTRIIEPYIGMNFISSNDPSKSLFNQLYSLGLSYTYKF